MPVPLLAAGFCQLNHGKLAPLRRLHPEDHIYTDGVCVIFDVFI
jgi:hypothetical protein